MYTHSHTHKHTQVLTHTCDTHIHVHTSCMEKSRGASGSENGGTEWGVDELITRKVRFVSSYVEDSPPLRIFQLHGDGKAGLIQ